MNGARGFWLGRMHPFRHHRLWTSIAWLGVLACVVLSLMPAQRLGAMVPGTDKLHHTAAYFTLMLWHGWLLAQPKSLRRAAGFLFLLGVALEGAQSFLPWRSGNDPLDLLANTIGIALAWLLLLTPLHDALRRWDRRF